MGIEDICDKCKGANIIKDKDCNMCGEESALFYAIGRDKTKLMGTYQLVNEETYDVLCTYDVKEE